MNKEPEKLDNPPDIAPLIEQHKAILYKVANAYCSDFHEQEDLIQEIIFQIIKGYENFDHQVKITTWMYRVALNVSISHYRKLKVRQQYFRPLKDNFVAIEQSEESGIEENVVRLRSYILEFEPLNRAILIMYLDGNSHTEISKAIGISVSNVGTKIGRIKKQLKKKFNQA
jgi:RNA polymerase sigma-70 factor (ECF subfamily)